MKKIKTLTIKESKWTTGSLYKDGAYCALGFACRALGWSDEAMDGMGLPEELPNAPEWMFQPVPMDERRQALAEISEAQFLENFDFQNVIPMVNDSKELPQEEKKSRLKKLFKLVGINLHFKK